MNAQIDKQVEFFSEAELESLEFVPEELEAIEAERVPDLDSISFEDVAKDLEAYFEGNIEEVGLEARRTRGAGKRRTKEAEKLQARGQGPMPNTPAFNQNTFANAQQAIRALTYTGLWGGAGTILNRANVRIDRQGNTGGANPSQNIQVQINGIQGNSTVAAVLIPNRYQNQGNNARARAKQAELLRRVKSALERSLYSWKARRPSIWTITGNFSN